MIVAWVSNSSLDFFSNVPYFLTKDAPSWTIWTELVPKYLNLTCQIWQTIFSFGKPSFSDKINILILDATIDYILSTKRFDKPLYVVINLFLTNVPLLYPLKTFQNLQFSNVFRGCRSETLVENRLNIYSLVFC